MKCLNHQFGEIEYTEDHLYEFPEGIIGFEQLRTFIVINDPDAEPFRWLISTEDKEFSVPLLDPSFIDPLYEVTNKFPDGVTIAVIATLKEPLELSTVNLRSPLLFDQGKHSGRQTVLDNERFDIQHKFIGEPQLVTGE